MQPEDFGMRFATRLLHKMDFCASAVQKVVQQLSIVQSVDWSVLFVKIYVKPLYKCHIYKKKKTDL